MAKGIPWNEAITVKTGAGFLVWTRKNDPGLYYGGDGKPVTEEQARAAGFDVDAHTTERKVQEELKAAESRIRREMALEEMRIRGKREPVFFVEHRSAGKYGVYTGGRGPGEKQLVTKGEDLDRASAEAIAHAMCERYYMTQVGFTKEEIDAAIAGADVEPETKPKGGAAAKD